MFHVINYSIAFCQPCFPFVYSNFVLKHWKWSVRLIFWAIYLICNICKKELKISYNIELVLMGYLCNIQRITDPIHLLFRRLYRFSTPSCCLVTMVAQFVVSKNYGNGEKWRYEWNTKIFLFLIRWNSFQFLNATSHKWILIG